MYQHHTAIEDTIVFPAWKDALPGRQYQELSEQFEELEQKMFGHDGFEDAVKRVAAPGPQEVTNAWPLAEIARRDFRTDPR